MGFGICGLGFGVHGLGIVVFGFMFSGFAIRVWVGGSEFRVGCFGFASIPVAHLMKIFSRSPCVCPITTPLTRRTRCPYNEVARGSRPHTRRSQGGVATPMQEGREGLGFASIPAARRTKVFARSPFVYPVTTPLTRGSRPPYKEVARGSRPPYKEVTRRSRPPCKKDVRVWGVHQSRRRVAGKSLPDRRLSTPSRLS